jgi:hypothetical protein
MGEIIAFPSRATDDEDAEVDLLTAVDAAIRDLRDISLTSTQEPVRKRADECRAMLEDAFRGSVV